MAVVGKLTFETEIETKSFDRQISEVEKELDDLVNLYNDIKNTDMFDDQEEDLKKLATQIEKTNNKLIDLKKRKQEANKEPIDENGGGFKGLNGIIKKVTKIGLGLIGLRTGMALLRNSISTVASQNDEIATKINTIKSAIANALTPVVQVVVNLFARLLAYAGYILNKWFGIDIFAKSTAKNTKKMQSGFSGANKEATKLKRTLAGFDEMNILQKDGGVSSGGGGGGVSPSDVDMSMFKDIEIPKWVQWIADNKEKLIGYLKEIAIFLGIAFATGTVLKFMGVIDALRTGLSGLISAFGTLSSLQVAGIFVGLIATLYGVIDLISQFKNGTESASRVLKDLALAIGGISIALIALQASNPVGWIGLAVSGIMGFVSWLKKDERALLDTETAQKNLNEATRKYKEGLDTLLSAQKDADEAEKNLIKVGKEHGWTLEETVWHGNQLVNSILNQEREYKDLSEEEKRLLEITNRYSTTQRKLGDELNENKKRIDEMTMAEVDKQRAIAVSSHQYETYRDALTKAWERGLISTAEFSDKMIWALASVEEGARESLVKGIPQDVKDMMVEMSYRIRNNKIPGIKLEAFLDTSKVNKALEEVKKRIKTVTGGYSSGGIVGFAKGGVVDLPRLASGAIINRPGPGVAIGGEKSYEGIVPLTDSQQMMRLGQAIGRYVNIRAEIPVSVGNRQIAREIRNINAEESFAFNG